tara:strand:- start:146 stop:409 length:264 start_codon:yes stop_codon:yes gene_type:complete
MRVKVTYTVDHEEVPRLVDELVASCRDEVKSLSNFVFDVRDVEGSRECIRHMQSKIEIVAGKLEDCLNLYAGYENVSKMPPEEAPSE